MSDVLLVQTNSMAANTVNVTLAITTLFDSRNITPTEVRAKFDVVSSLVQKVMCAFIMARPYYSRVSSGNLGVRSAHLKIDGVFESADEDGTFMDIDAFEKMLETIMLKDTPSAKKTAVKELYSSIPDRPDVRKFVIVLLTNDINNVHIDYAFFVRFYPETEPWKYMWPRIDDRYIMGCMRPYLSETQGKERNADVVEVGQWKWDGHRFYFIEFGDGSVYLMTRKGHVTRAPDGWPYEQRIHNTDTEKVTNDDAVYQDTSYNNPMKTESSFGDFLELSKKRGLVKVWDGEMIARSVADGVVLPATSVASMFTDPTIYMTYVIFDVLCIDGKWVTDLPLIKRLRLINEVYEEVDEMTTNVGSVCLALTMRADYTAQVTDGRIEGIVYKHKNSTYGGTISADLTDYPVAYQEYLASEKTNAWRKFKWGSDEVTVGCIDGKRGRGKLESKIDSLNMYVMFDGQALYIGALSVTNSKYHAMLEDLTVKEANGEAQVTDGTPNAHTLLGVPDLPSHCRVRGVKCTNRVKFQKPLLVDVLGDNKIVYELKDDCVMHVGIRNVRIVGFRDDTDACIYDITNDVLDLFGIHAK